jgi:dGTP triphosphohydrolase
MANYIAFQGQPRFFRNGNARWAYPSRRWYAGETDEHRTAFKHDEDEVVYSNAFRRLSRKSQIVVRPDSDHFRSRLTHTLEVNQIAESIACRLGLNIDLVNAIAFAHDIGHCPFGHAGERGIQTTVRHELIERGLCDQKQLAVNLKNAFGLPVGPFVGRRGEPINDHWLFHHAMNSYRLLERKLKGVQSETKRGVLSHSWAPWHRVPKFGMPETFEAQAVAIADQVAGLNHDIEDILRWDEVNHDVASLRDDIAAFFEKKQRSGYQAASFCDWFLPANSPRESGFGRRQRLSRIINSVVDWSLVRLQRRNGASWEDAVNRAMCLTAGTPLETELVATEQFIRDRVIQGESWFRHRDAMSEAVIRTAYNFFQHYSQSDREMPAVEARLASRVRSFLSSYRHSVSESYEEDTFYQAVMRSTVPGKGSTVASILKTVDYVAGMTEKRITEVHDLALELFA